MALYFFRGKGTLRYVTTLTTPSAPTATQINAGVDISPAVAAVTGFTTQLNRISQPVLSSATELQIDGPQTFVDSSLTLIEDDGTGASADEVLRQTTATTLVDGATGYFVFCRTDKVITAGDKVTVYYGKVGAANPSWSIDAEPARIVVDIVLLATPNKNVTVA